MTTATADPAELERYGPTTRRPVGEVVHLDRFGNRPYRTREKGAQR